MAMKLEFVPVEDFYFALTLAVKTLEEIDRPTLTKQVRSRLEQKCGQSSTVAAVAQNTFNYVFHVLDYDNSPAPQLIVSVSDWQNKLRLSSDYGWIVGPDRKPVRTTRYNQRQKFARELRLYLQNWLEVPIAERSLLRDR